LGHAVSAWQPDSFSRFREAARTRSGAMPSNYAKAKAVYTQRGARRQVLLAASLAAKDDGKKGSTIRSLSIARSVKP